MQVGDMAWIKVVVTKIIEDAKGKAYEVELADQNKDDLYLHMFANMLVREKNLGLLELKKMEDK